MNTESEVEENIHYAMYFIEKLDMVRLMQMILIDKFRNKIWISINVRPMLKFCVTQNSTIESYMAWHTHIFVIRNKILKVSAWKISRKKL